VWAFEDPLAERCANAPMAWIDEQLDAANIDYNAVHTHINALMHRRKVARYQPSKALLRIAASILLALLVGSNETHRTPAIAIPPQTSAPSSTIPTASLPITPSAPTRNETTAVITTSGTSLQGASWGTAVTIASNPNTGDLRPLTPVHVVSTVNLTVTTRGIITDTSGHACDQPQSTGTLTGTVRDSTTSAVISGASVSFGGSNMTNNSSGVSTLTSPACASPATMVSKSGYYTAQIGDSWLGRPEDRRSWTSRAPQYGGQETQAQETASLGVEPATTLLLPYFEVDTAAASGTGSTTLFTITNTSRLSQIAHVTVWTDWSSPVLDFNIFLTGCDVQGVNMFDVLNNTSHPNVLLSGASDVPATCNGLSGSLPTDLVTVVGNALTIGTGYNTASVSCSSPIGSNTGTIAKGYVTIDVASYCPTHLPTDTAYDTGDRMSILFDNVLTGDYQQIDPTSSGAGSTASANAQRNPLVHIRAVPEGGLSGAADGIPVATTNLPFTFYDRYTTAGSKTGDHRQPLPSTFAARYIQGGTGAFATNYKIWREGMNAGLPTPLLPSPGTTDLGSWMYLNLSSGSAHVTSDGPVFDATLTAQRPGIGPHAPATGGSRTPTQNWVIVSMFGGVGSNYLSVDFDAAWLGNGCTPAPVQNP